MIRKKPLHTIFGSMKGFKCAKKVNLMVIPYFRDGYMQHKTTGAQLCMNEWWFTVEKIFNLFFKLCDSPQFPSALQMGINAAQPFTSLE
jgi:hypothetical protein